MMRRPIQLKSYITLRKLNDQAVQTENKQSQAIMTKEVFQNQFSGCDDIVLKEIALDEDHKKIVFLAFVAELTDPIVINEYVVKPILLEAKNLINVNGNLVGYLKNFVLTVGLIEELNDFSQVLTKLLSGNIILFIEGEPIVLSILAKGWESRGVEEPATEAVVRGSREGFNESIYVNMALIRRRLKSPDLKFELMELGQRSHTDVAICYIEGIAHQEIIDTVRQRLNGIKIDAILESGYVEEFIEDAPYSIFPTVGNTEKPDAVAGKILEGRVAILIDGTPFVLTIPYLFIESLQTTEDYYSRFYFASIERMLRFFALFITVSLPGFYVAIICFHRDVIPLKLLLTMVEAREGIPFSPFTEALILGISFEILREAGVRMPRPIGQAVSIVGALILGEALIQAGIASAPIVIVTATTAIASFMITPMNGTVPIIRLATIVSANILGFTGMLLTWILFLLHMCSLKSYGIPYMAPLAPLNGADLKDVFLRFPLKALFTRPKSLTWGRGTTNTKFRVKNRNS